jgi:spermidine synthase
LYDSLAVRAAAPLSMATSIEISEEAGVRYLHFGSRWVQGAMRIARAWALELDYTRDMMLPLLLRGEGFPRSVLLIGLGAASQTKFLYRHFAGTALTVVEIEPAVVAAARQFFKLPDDPRVRIEIADGNGYVATTHKRFDFILVDGFNAKGHAGALDTTLFYRHCRSRLAPHGVLATNLFTRSRSARPSVARIAAEFDGRAIALAPCDSGNTAAFAAVGDPIDAELSELSERARVLRAETGLNLLPTLARFARAPGNRGGRLRL